jgi:dynein heavy chain
MITAGKNYITEEGMKNVWDYPQEELISKLLDCVKLNEAYQQSFQRAKKKLEENPDERQFEFSEMYIFGKINSFAGRCHKIIDMMSTIKSFLILGDSNIEGIEQIWSRFQLILTTIKKKPYDLLDYRKMEFDADYEEFKRQIQELQVRQFYHLYLTLQDYYMKKLASFSPSDNCRLTTICCTVVLCSLLTKYSFNFYRHNFTSLSIHVTTEFLQHNKHCK